MNKDKVIPISSQIEEKIEIIENTINIQSTILKKNINSFYYGWRNFAFKNDIINIAIGMIIATSFKSLINSLVVDIIMPILIGLGAGTTVSNLFIVLVKGKNYNGTYTTLENAQNDGAVTLNYGIFLNIFFDLILVSLLLYILLRVINKIKLTEKNLRDRINEHF